jgi:hypothetical protein
VGIKEKNMGQSTDGQLCYGIQFHEGFEFPWENYGEEEWWREVNGYKPPFQLYSDDNESGYAPGIKTKNGLYGRVEVEDEKLVDSYYEHQHEWDEKNPIPVELVNYCSGECAMYIIALKESFKSANRGFPEVINPEELKVTEEQKQKLLDFCNKYLAEVIEEYNSDEYNEEKIVLEPKWYLSSYWG